MGLRNTTDRNFNQFLHYKSARRSFHFCLLIFTFCFLIFFSSCSRRALLDQAQTAWDGGDYAAAADHYEQYLKESPQGDKAEFARLRVATICQRDLQQYDRAIQHYIHFIEEFPKSSDIVQARMQLATCYSLTKKHREAIGEFEGVLPKVGDEKERRRVRLNIADLYFELNDRGQALAEYQKVIADAPYDELGERAWLRIGGIRLLRDEYEEAVPAFETVAANTKDPMIRRAARFGVADCYERTFQYDKAVETLEQTEPDPKSPDYIKQRIAAIRDQQRQRNLSSPSSLGWPNKQ